MVRKLVNNGQEWLRMVTPSRKFPYDNQPINQQLFFGADSSLIGEFSQGPGTPLMTSDQNHQAMTIHTDILAHLKRETLQTDNHVQILCMMRVRLDLYQPQIKSMLPLHLSLACLVSCLLLRCRAWELGGKACRVEVIYHMMPACLGSCLVKIFFETSLKALANLLDSTYIRTYKFKCTFCVYVGVCVCVCLHAVYISDQMSIEHPGNACICTGCVHACVHLMWYVVM